MCGSGARPVRTGEDQGQTLGPMAGRWRPGCFCSGADPVCDHHGGWLLVDGPQDRQAGLLDPLGQVPMVPEGRRSHRRAVIVGMLGLVRTLIPLPSQSSLGKKY